jgi:hypothetical protein
VFEMRELRTVGAGAGELEVSVLDTSLVIDRRLE